MCSYSVVADYGKAAFPWLADPLRPSTTVPYTPYIPPAMPTPSPEEWKALKKFMDLVEAAKNFDEAANQPHCEDPNKTFILEKILERIEAIENHLNIKSEL